MSPRAQADTLKPVVIVAGAGPGIGTSIAHAFGAEGFAIALVARDSARLAKRHAEITAAGFTAAPFIVDLADGAATRNAVGQVRDWAGGHPSSLVYNAFTLHHGSADQLDLAESERAMRVNFLAATQLTALVAPPMRASGYGSLLFTGGGAAQKPSAGLSSLCAGKAALRVWVLTLAEELAGTGIRVGRQLQERADHRLGETELRDPALRREPPCQIDKHDDRHEHVRDQAARRQSTSW